MALNYSAAALPALGVRLPDDGGKVRKPWGLLVHTTGRGVPETAARRSRRPIDVALEVYIASQKGSNGYPWGGPGYVIDYDGRITQLAPDDILTNHAGGPDRASYLSGGWLKRCSPAMVAQWHTHWAPRYAHPYALFPSKSPNEDYIGVEMIPIGSDLGGKPMREGLLFTKAQHDAAVVLALDLAVRHGWPTGWAQTGRLVGHEDVQPILRHDKGGGWDPGWLRAKPYFDFASVRERI